MIPRPRLVAVLMSPEENRVTEFRVWNETGDLLGEHDNEVDANRQVVTERDACPCGDAGELGCGVLHPHGIHVQVCADGFDVTNTYFDNQLG